MAVDGGSGGGYLKSCFGRGEGGKKEGWGLGLVQLACGTNEKG